MLDSEREGNLLEAKEEVVHCIQLQETKKELELQETEEEAELSPKSSDDMEWEKS